MRVHTTYEQCNGDEFWYERTAYRKIPYSSCEGGDRPDRGPRHVCPAIIGIGSHGFLFWTFIALLPFGAAAVAAWWWTNGSVGAIRLDEHRPFGDNTFLATLASIPNAIIALAQQAWANISARLPASRYRPLDSDAEILGHYEDD